MAEGAELEPAPSIEVSPAEPTSEETIIIYVNFSTDAQPTIVNLTYTTCHDGVCSFPTNLSMEPTSTAGNYKKELGTFSSGTEIDWYVYSEGSNWTYRSEEYVIEVEGEPIKDNNTEKEEGLIPFISGGSVIFIILIIGIVYRRRQEL